MNKQSKVTVTSEDVSKNSLKLKDLEIGTYFVFAENPHNKDLEGLMVVPWYEVGNLSYQFHSVLDPSLSWSNPINFKCPTLKDKPVKICDVKVTYTLSE